MGKTIRRALPNTLLQITIIVGALLQLTLIMTTTSTLSVHQERQAGLPGGKMMAMKILQNILFRQMPGTQWELQQLKWIMMVMVI